MMVRPLSRKDIFYSGSVVNLPEYQSQKSLANYRQSVISIPKSVRGDMKDIDIEKEQRMYIHFFRYQNSINIIKNFKKININFHFLEPLCPCLVLPDSFKEALATMMDMSLLKDPVFLLIGISNVFGMAGLYVPFVYLVDAAVLDVRYLLIFISRCIILCDQLCFIFF